MKGDFAFRPGERAALAERLQEHTAALRDLVITIDGPAASGKSTTARAVAARLGIVYLDTGAMYRAVTLLALRTGVALDSGAALAALASAHDIRFEPRTTGEPRVALDGADVTEAIRGAEVTRSVSQVAAHPELRAEMVRRQRALGAAGGLVADGRDIGTVVFPEAPVKVFLVADTATRAERRWLEERARGRDADRDAIAADLERRDRDDSTRAASPLVPAADAVRLDTSALTPQEQIDAVLALALRRVRGARMTAAPPGLRGRVQLVPAESERVAQPGFRAFHSRLYKAVHAGIGFGARLGLGCRVYVHPAARQPGSVLFACNHIAGLDPPLAGAAVPGESYYVAKLELFRQAWLARLIARFNAIPIRRGSADFEALDRAVALLRAGRNVFMFPEGTRQKPGRLGAPRWGFGYVALHAARPIVPVFVRGTRDARPPGLRREPLEIWVGEAVEPRLQGSPDHAAYKEAGELVMERIGGLMLRSAAARPLPGLDLPGEWAQAATVATPPASSETDAGSGNSA